jgi:hypothetical protein
MMTIAPAKAHALPRTLDERRAKIRKASLTTQKKFFDSSCCLGFFFCVFIATIAGSSACSWVEKIAKAPYAGAPRIDRPLTTEYETEHETDSERGNDRLSRVFADVLLAVVLETADTIERIIPYLFRATEIFIGHCACGGTEIFRRFARLRPATLCFLSHLR